ncbi:ABC transporter permease [Rhizobium sp. VS19-DR104.2]|uniref:ABC transporter permease n=1 Tax=unclassified Rhizobium TaxID=2613769 RepID=UPI001CC5FFD4|nr:MULTISPECIES: ABC transporter permease [unclassified Rhizobium]MBZ5763408.1 ABC transporter permease [Rhizobium sp. VS19-DR96]MBZ5769303.1 ABC transporter permease [Rhizobium sp. VS19-DR129.2]MBZ5776888.1 ABC transporter permease [Rhizobium sp. VS19-DRK62.2]MBZ5787999.1 ABC transporter permease [Rhizobium sp. VS19-DR121]MBZ5805452.1 ABC transporter permease [Rhizobium sp. VS19-DR181]
MSLIAVDKPMFVATPRWRQFCGKLVRNRSAMIGGGIVLLLLLTVVLSPLVAPFDPLKVNPIQRLKPPSAHNWMGTDEVGRDLFSRILFGTRYFVLICVVTASISASIGTLLGLVAGAGSSLTDSIIMRFIDVLLAFPYILMVLVVVAVLGPSLWTGMVSIGIAGIPGYARLVRSAVLTVLGEDYVVSARALGAGEADILFGTVLPNVLSPLIVYLSFSMPLAALLTSSLSFVGLGTQPPAPEWGAMLVNSRTYLFSAWWAVAAPGMALFVSIFGLNILGNGLRDVLDPRN